MHVLITADTLSGVWTYARELVTGLVSRGVRVTLVSLGDVPLPEQTAWMESLHGLDYRPTAFRLDWMQEGEQDLTDSCAYLTQLIEELRPDVVHFSQMCYGHLKVNVPRVVTAHGDLVSWWMAVHGHKPSQNRWLRWYCDVVARGLAGASAVVAPSSWMMETLQSCYTRPRYAKVIYNGRNPIFFNPYVSKDDSVLAVGRLWDASRQLSLLTEHAHPMPVCIVGSDQPHQASALPIRADVKLAVDNIKVALVGPQTESQLRTLYSRSAIYAATSRYEPFSMTTLEAAFSRCAIVANDIPSMREIWGDAALYFRTNDASSLAELLRTLAANRELRQAYAGQAYMRARERFTAKRMIDEYLALYQQLILRQSMAA